MKRGKQEAALVSWSTKTAADTKEVGRKTSETGKASTAIKTEIFTLENSKTEKHPVLAFINGQVVKNTKDSGRTEFEQARASGKESTKIMSTTVTGKRTGRTGMELTLGRTETDMMESGSTRKSMEEAQISL